MLRALIFFILVLVISLIYNYPMRWFYQQVKPDTDLIVLTNITGTIWSGSATVRATNTNLNYTADNWQWGFQLLSLFKGQMNWQVKHTAQNIEAKVGTDILAFGQRLHFELLSNINALAVIHPRLNLVSGNLSGAGKLIAPMTCKEGSNVWDITLNNLSVLAFKLQQIDFLIACAQAGSFEISYHSQDPDTQLKGELQIDRQGNFQTSARASSSNQQIAEQLAQLASKTLSKGRYLLEWQGNVREL